MATIYDLSGKTFNFLTALTRIPRTRPGDCRWLCRCVCGKEVEVQSDRLRRGRIKSCGCKRYELISAGNARHGHFVSGKSSGEWRSYNAAVQRCHNPSHRSYGRYGAVGIAVCEEWRNDFLAFVRDVGPRPAGSTLDRIDGSKGYEPGNCRWSTPKEQANNMRNNRHVLATGQRMTIRAAADTFHLPYEKFRRALYRHGSYVSEGGHVFTLLQALGA